MFVMFRVPGPPVAKARPRVTTHGTYTPRSTRLYETKVRAAYMEQVGDVRFAQGAPVALKVLVFKTPPKSSSKAKRLQMLSGAIGAVQKPDWDNFGKIVSDALNGAAWEDDAQVVNAQVVKLYGEEPGIWVLIADAELFAHEVTSARAMFAACKGE